MVTDKVICQSCNAEVEGVTYHLGFSNMDALYCSSCPRVLLLKDWNLLAENGITRPGQDEFQFYNRHVLPFYARIEALFRPCVCGGRYRYMNPPRCPLCNGLLRGNCYEDKPVLKQRDYHVFICGGSVEDRAWLKSVET